MLKKLRKKKFAKKVWIVLAILIVPAFVLWGLGSAVKSPKEAIYAGKIFAKKISTLEYQDALEATKNQLIIQLGENFYQLEKYLNLPGRAWERLVLLYEAKKRKIKISDNEVREIIESYPFFQRSGKFNPRLYEETLKYFFRTQARIFEEQTRQNLAVAKLYKAVTDGLNLTEDEIKKEYQKSNEEVSVHYIASIPADFAKDIRVLEQELKDYFAANSLQFKQPLSFNLEYVSFALENADEKAIKDKINKFLLRLKGTSDWVKVAKDFNLTVKETGLFTQTGPIPGIGGWSAEILNLIAALKVGQVSLPIQTEKDIYILKLKERREPHIPDFETIKTQIKEAFLKERTQKLAQEKIETCLEKLKEKYRRNPHSADFSKIAQDFGLKSDSTSLFKYGSYIEGIGQSDKFWLASQELKEAEFSEIVDLPSGFYILKLKSRIPVDEKKFEAEKSEFTKKLLVQKKDERFNKFLQDLKNQAQGLNAKLP